MLSTRAAAAAATTAVAAGTTYAYLSSRTAHAESPSASAPKAFRSGLNFTSLKLHSVESVNDNTKRLRFELPNPDAVTGLKLVSSLLMVARPAGSWLPVARPYTPVSDPDETGFIEFMIKHYPNGRGSTHMHSLTPGQSVSFAGPLPGFSYVPNSHPRVAMIAGGAGITPMWQLIRGILKNPDDRTNITLVWGVNRDEDMFYADELKALQKEYPGRLNVHYTISSPVAGSQEPQGRITRAVLERANLAHDKDTKVFVCGPPAMEKAVMGFRGAGGILSEMGYARPQVHKF